MIWISRLNIEDNKLADKLVQKHLNYLEVSYEPGQATCNPIVLIRPYTL